MNAAKPQCLSHLDARISSFDLNLLHHHTPNQDKRMYRKYNLDKENDSRDAQSQMHASNRSATVRFGRTRDALSAAQDEVPPSVCGSQPTVWLVDGAEEKHENAKFKRRSEVP